MFGGIKRVVCLSGMLFLSALMLSACGSGTTTVMDPVSAKVTAHGVNIVEEPSNVTVPDDDVAYFKKQLNQDMYAPDAFVPGNDLTLTYRFVQFDEGSRFSRWLTGGIGNAGEASLSIEVVYTKDGKEVGRIMAGGKIGSGVFGGSSDDALDKAAEEITNYTRTNFK